jgi:uncharacterized protein (DUF1697 family)
MVYVALLRGINVGGNTMISMASLKEIFESLGLQQVRTYINSGNVIFSCDDTDVADLQRRLETAIEQHSGLAIKLVLRTRDDMQRLVASIPNSWMEDTSLRCYVLFLWPDIDQPATLESIPVHQGVEEVRYFPGAVVQVCAKKDATKSHLTRIVGTPLYAKLTMRNSNTVRKLLDLMEQAT